ncbi:signal peptidase I [Patulibacter sp. SYSU D01012]|uniref:signal peptidase I n=1 Tax=Patulibacter sp. SYSU D01012 TaxID=2817381 RepID=UPI001B31134B
MSAERSPRQTAGASSSGKKRKLHPVVELVGLVVVALGLALGIQWLLVKPYQIPSGSMLPTLDLGQRVLVNRIGHRLGGDPSVGDVVVFHPPRGAEPQKSGLKLGDESPGLCGDRDNIAQGRPCASTVGGKWGKENYIKRVVAGPGDTIAVRDGHVIRNGKRQSEPFISDTCEGQGSDNNPCTLPKAIKVPAGMYYMMGDNRGESNDSRFWGPVPRDWIVGGAFATYWPPKKIGGV